jgi:pimeloyl-ACP methyl ester carboxylesterase
VDPVAATRSVLRELRAVPEFAAFVGTTPLTRLAPGGDGHPVLVLPGLLADDLSTRPLRWFLRQRGYSVHGWRLGTNRGPSAATTEGLARRLAALADRHGRTVSIVGWSMGGVFARQLALRTPSSVRSTVTLGSPISGYGGPRQLAMPATSVYSRTGSVALVNVVARSIGEPRGCWSQTAGASSSNAAATVSPGSASMPSS